MHADIIVEYGDNGNNEVIMRFPHPLHFETCLFELQKQEVSSVIRDHRESQSLDY